MKRLLYILLFVYSLAYSQQKTFRKFELLYDIPQQIVHYYKWPKYDLDGMQLYNDTLFTLSVKEDYLTYFPLSVKEEKLKHVKLNFINRFVPMSMTRFNEKWYFVTTNSGVIEYSKENGSCKNIIKEQKYQSAKYVFFIQNKLILFSGNSFSGEGFFDLYDTKGNILSSLKCKNIIFMYPTVYNNKITDGYSEVVVNDDIIQVSKTSVPDNYIAENTFVGSWHEMCYFINWENRNNLFIYDLKENLTKEKFIIPVKFKDTDLGIPEENSFNLRVFSEDNNTFYFVTLKHGHLLIYKAVR